MMPMQQNAHLVSLRFLLEGMVNVEQDICVGKPSVDARNIENNGLFLAVAGSQSHGLEYVEQAIDAGAIAIVYELASGVELLVERIKKRHSVILIGLTHLSASISEIAAKFYRRPSSKMTVVGVTGTNGKTSVSHFVAQLMQDEGTACGVVGTLGWGRIDALREAINTTPDGVSVQQQLAYLFDEGIGSVAMEVSSHGLDQGRVTAVEYKGAVFTNLSHDHLDYHQTMTAYGEAKLALFKCPSLEFAVLNNDDEFSKEIEKVLAPTVKVLTFSRSLDNKDCLLISNEELSASGVSFDVSLNGNSVHIQSGLFGRFNVDNLVASIAVLIAMGRPLSDATINIQKVKSVAGRMQIVSVSYSAPIVVVDYAHTPDALKLALLSLREHCSGKLKLIFGCGGNRDEAKRPLMGAIAVELADAVTITNDNPRLESAEEIVRQIKIGMSDMSRVDVVLGRQQAIEKVILGSMRDDIILVAGKGHEDYQQIGDKKIAFSDVAEVNKVLNKLAGEDGCKP
ncbi:MAG: UDP-N-acetylmuramoyl-L-alanyl-D-glutamate--2,6-diaminopimelate ligase [Cycloclasticus sp. symbiont of Bathymodiolus heckerae]|nr:MAG: UDP-N-acetylmuramoyl-L-alanyl-D-glutamate--2,6-diaminopimelate ligase [Cycloclasticus sp. symbiont of Bathymodiolus heckerae]